ncbi:hypothetical protein GYMLUDRAFT_957049 [Collybiopsis luxurians FD-317 M1]|nr:hypothetical protein GYMLUDRAFT_957049 [Collybiopsis luxurians FD-317 M1]
MPDRFKPRADISKKVINERLRWLGIPQRSEISQIVHDIDRDFEDYAQQISSLESQLAFLRSQQKRLQSCKTTLSSLLSPIHYLPNEILLQIFLLHTRRDILYAVLPSALSIASVCSRWRKLAISCADIWSSFDVGFFALEETDPQLEARLDMFLERSRDRPLDLHIMYPKPEHILFPKLVKHSNRWRHLTLEGEIDLDLQISLPSLETLTFDSDDHRDVMGFGLIPSVPNKLRKISTNTCLPSSRDVIAPPPVEYVTSLTFSPEYDDLFDSLVWFPNLCHLGLTDHYDLEQRL